MKCTLFLIAIPVLAATTADAQFGPLGGTKNPLFGLPAVSHAGPASEVLAGVVAPNMNSMTVASAAMPTSPLPWHVGLDFTLATRNEGAAARTNLSMETRFWQLQIQSAAARKGNVDWLGLLSQQTRVDAIMHALRLRQSKFHVPVYHSPFFKGYAEALRGYFTTPLRWSDGDDFLTNDIGHPIMGAVFSYTYTDFDRRCQTMIFGEGEYWSCVRRGTIYASLASVNWEWNPLMSESSLGHIGKFHSCANGKCKGECGWTDFVMTPVGGMGIRIAGDYARARLWPTLDRRLSGSTLGRVINVTVKILTAPSHVLNCAFNLDFKDAWRSTRRVSPVGRS